MFKIGNRHFLVCGSIETRKCNKRNGEFTRQNLISCAKIVKRLNHAVFNDVLRWQNKRTGARGTDDKSCLCGPWI